MSVTDKPVAVPTPEQQQVIDRIRVQRERWRARRQAQRHMQAAMPRQPSGVNPAAPLADRLLAFARLHPVFVAAAAGAAALAGPRRLLRWAGLLLPLAARLRR
ncbi:hypothetical protein MASR1M59_18530 [Melaminivora sp.]